MKRVEAQILFALAGLAASVACATVLGIRPPGREAFPHRAHVTEGVSCVQCHVGVRTATETDTLHLPDDESCVDCHEDPHDKRSCLGCHGRELNVQRVAAAKVHLRFSHGEHLPRIANDCARCHIDVAEEGRSLLPPMAACLGCHEHADTFDVNDCDQCHVKLEAEGSRPVSHLVHDEDYVDRHGAEAAVSRELCSTCHTERQCASCHGANVPALPQRLSFDRPGLAGLHRAGFRSRHAHEARVDPGLCVTCHQPATCQRCHADKGIAGVQGATRNPHPPGWVGFGAGSNAHGAAAWQDPASCASCHSGAGEALCVSCHAVGGVGGNIHPPGWSSSRDPQRDLPCRMCHGGLR